MRFVDPATVPADAPGLVVIRRRRGTPDLAERFTVHAPDGRAPATFSVRPRAIRCATAWARELEVDAVEDPGQGALL